MITIAVPMDLATNSLRDVPAHVRFSAASRNLKRKHLQHNLRQAIGPTRCDPHSPNEAAVWQTGATR